MKLSQKVTATEATYGLVYTPSVFNSQSRIGLMNALQWKIFLFGSRNCGRDTDLSSNWNVQYIYYSFSLSVFCCHFLYSSHSPFVSSLISSNIQIRAV